CPSLIRLPQLSRRKLSADASRRPLQSEATCCPPYLCRVRASVTRFRINWDRDRPFLNVNRRLSLPPYRRANGTPLLRWDRLVPVAKGRGPARSGETAKRSDVAERGRSLFAHRGKQGVAWARSLKRQDSLPVSTISQ